MSAGGPETLAAAGRPQSTAESPELASFSVVIPAYNEEDAVGSIVERVLALRPLLADVGVEGPEVIVVDDGSRDRTVEIVSSIDGARLIRHTHNRGYGAALKTGLLHARGDLVAFLDADETYPPESFPKLCEVALAGADMVVGCRMASESSEMPLSRKIGNQLFATLISVLGSGKISDSASGMRVLRRDVLARLQPLPDGLHFTPIMSLRAMHEGLSVVEVPIPYGERSGHSKLSVVRDGLQYLRSIVWITLGYNPVRVLGGLGVTGVAVALLVGLGLIVTRLRGVTELSPWGVTAVFTALVAGVAGVSLLSLGATFNYLLALLRREPIRFGLFGKPLFSRPLERHFGWLGLLVVSLGFAIAASALTLGLYGWPLERLWLYLVGSALLILVGLQLTVSWALMRTLQEVSERDGLGVRANGENG